MRFRLLYSEATFMFALCGEVAPPPPKQLDGDGNAYLSHFIKKETIDLAFANPGKWFDIA